MDDSRIVELYLKRDETALEITEAKYGKRLLWLACSITGNRETAEECVNDTYLRAWESIPPNKPYKYLLPYLLRITRQIAINRVNMASADKRSAEITELTLEMESCLPSAADIEGELEAKELAAKINCFLSGVGKQKRDVFIRRYWFCDTVSDISKRMGFKESKVKTMLFRLRADLRAYLENEGYSI